MLWDAHSPWPISFSPHLPAIGCDGIGLLKVMIWNRQGFLLSHGTSGDGGQSFAIAPSTLLVIKAVPRTSPPKELWIWSLGPSELA